MKYCFLKKEDQIVMLLTRLTFTVEDKECLFELVDDKSIDWEYILCISIKNKILGLIWGNICRFGLINKVPSRLRQVMLFNFLGIRERTIAYINEANKIGEMLTNNFIKHAFLKGSYLVPNMYKSYGFRNMNDVDIMIKYSDAKKVTSIMNKLGYIQGEYNTATGVVEKIDRKKEVFWKSSMNNLYPFLKVAGSDYINCFKIDFCFSLDLNIRKDVVENILDNSPMGNLNPDDFFLHLCCHFFKEATNVIWIYNVNDITLIKLCDIREYVFFKMDDVYFEKAIEKANKWGYSKAMYYTLYYLSLVYQDGYESTWMKKLEIDDDSFVNKFGSNDFGNSKEWTKNVWDRIFSKDNIDELGDNLPKYKLLT